MIEECVLRERACAPALRATMAGPPDGAPRRPPAVGNQAQLGSCTVGSPSSGNGSAFSGFKAIPENGKPARTSPIVLLSPVDRGSIDRSVTGSSPGTGRPTVVDLDLAVVMPQSTLAAPADPSGGSIPLVALHSVPGGTPSAHCAPPDRRPRKRRQTGRREFSPRNFSSWTSKRIF